MEYGSMTTDMIVSLTSHGSRLQYVGQTIFSILRYCRCKVVVTLFKHDVQYIPPDLQLMINRGVVELIIAPDDLGPHLKYFYTMCKYKSVPIITIDDDCLYSPDFMPSFVNAYKTHPTDVSCRRAHLMTFTDGKLNPYNQWTLCVKHATDYRHILATGVGGVLYPPNILQVDDIHLTELKQCLYADDIYLKVIENRRNIGMHIINITENHPQQQQYNEIKSTGLCNINVNRSRNDVYIAKFMKDLV